MDSVKRIADLLRDRGIERAILLDDHYGQSALDKVIASVRERDDLLEEFIEEAGEMTLARLAQVCACSESELRDDPTVLTQVVAGWLAEGALPDEWRTDPPPDELTTWLREVRLKLGIKTKHERAGLSSFQQHLGALGLRAEHFGLSEAASVTSTEARTAKLIFLDYYFGEPGQQESIERSIGLAREIFKAAESEKPIIVLMSSEPPKGEPLEDYIEASHILAGNFHVVHKEELECPIRVYTRLERMVRSQPLANAMVQFLDEFPGAIENAAREITDIVRRLQPGDYWNLYHIGLGTDGDPLGDYLAWLIGQQFRPRLFAGRLLDVVRQINRVGSSDGLTDALPGPPSRQLIGLFADTVYEDVGPLRQHAHGTRRDQWDGQQGDVFVGESRAEGGNLQLRLLITPECDLARARSRSGDAKMAFSRNVILVKGIGEVIAAGDSAGLTGPQIMRLDGELLKVTWEFKSIEAIQFTNLRRRDMWTRRKRLRAPFLAAIQQEFVADLGRVGVPAMTADVVPLRGMVWTRLDDDSWLSVEVERAGAFFNKGTEKVVHLHLGGDLIAALKQALIDAKPNVKRLSSVNVSDEDWRGLGRRDFAARNRHTSATKTILSNRVEWLYEDEWDEKPPSVNKGRCHIFVVFSQAAK